MRKDKIYVFLILITIIFFLSISVSCAKTKEQIETEVDEELEEEIKVEIEEVPQYSFVSKSGEITSDEIWSGEIYITGDIFVTEGVTLTILPGTKVIFSAHSDDQHIGNEVPLDEWIARHDDPTWTLEYSQSHCCLSVSKLIARGTADEMIIFTSDSENPDGADWEQIHMGPGSIVEYCIAEYARGALDVAENTGDSVLISNNILRHNLWTALTIHKGSLSTVINNTIYDSGGHQGIAVEDDAIIENNEIKNCKAGIITSGINPTLKNNILIDNDCGIYIVGNSTPTIEGNIISSPNGAQNDWTYRGKSIYFAWSKEEGYGNVTGINFVYASPTIIGNKIEECASNISVSGESSSIISQNIIINGRDNGIHFEQSFEGSPQIYENNLDNSNNIGMSSSCSIEAINNWWGTTDPEEIELRIWHDYDDSSLGTVTYEPFLSQPVEFD